MDSHLHHQARSIGLLMILIACAGRNARANNYENLHSFGLVDASGQYPTAAPVESTDGYLYGVASRGGRANKGVIYRIDKNGTHYQVVRHLGISADEPQFPVARLVEDQDGLLFGVSLWGGAFGGGTAFKLNKDGTGLTVLWHFQTADQEPHSPSGALLLRTNGFLYGTCLLGGSNGCGALFRVRTSGSGFAVLRHFGGVGQDGRYPIGGVVESPAGILFGITAEGGSAGGGTLFRIRQDGMGYALLHQFNGGISDGLHPSGELLMTAGGDLFGTARMGGTANKGIAFKLQPQILQFEILCSFGTSTNSAQFPSSGLLLPGDGYLYGCAELGGIGHQGCIFRISKGGCEFDLLHSFDASVGDPGAPETGLLQMGGGTLAGAVKEGGGSRQGALFRMQKDGGDYLLIHEFSSTGNDGVQPLSTPIRASDGLVYGSCSQGGLYGNGILFQMSTNGAGYTVRHHFAANGTNGICPIGPLIQANDGVLYGATRRGGQFGCGTVFKFLKETGVLSVIHHFNPDGGSGAFPLTGLIETSDGYLYGRTLAGGIANGSTIFRLSRTGSAFSIVHSFENSIQDDGLPYSGLLEGSDRALYGTASDEGTNQAGSIFRMTKDGSTFVSLHDFSWVGNDGRFPHGGLVQTHSGKLYGCSRRGGMQDLGTLFSLEADGSGYTVVHSFVSTSDSGWSPSATLVDASDGWLYGTTVQGGFYGGGTIFRFHPTRQIFENVYAFRGEPQTGALPYAGLVAETNGELLGAASGGGDFGYGALFRVTPLDLTAERGTQEIVVTWRGVPGARYHLQATEDLRIPWHDLAGFSNVSGKVLYRESSAQVPRRLFRVQGSMSEGAASSLISAQDGVPVVGKQGAVITTNAFCFEAPEFKLALDDGTGLPRQLTSFSSRLGASHEWLNGSAQLTVRHQESGALGRVGSQAVSGVPGFGLAELHGPLTGVPLVLTQQWSVVDGGVLWQCSFWATNSAEGHDIIVDLPVLKPGLKIFTPTAYGVMDLSVYPSFEASVYGDVHTYSDSPFTMPLVSILDPISDSGLTIALPADYILPNFQVSWQDSHVLRFTFSSRAMGGARSSMLKILFLSHAADYRDVLNKYIGLFPTYFHPGLSRGGSEGAFYYHYIHDHPDFQEMARQQVRFLWSSFWFTHMGEFLPATNVWKPFTFTNYWKFGEWVSDERIGGFVQSLRERGIGTYAYFNVSEWGGNDGETGSSAGSDQILQERFSDALVKDASGNTIITWENAKVVNPGSRYSLWPFYLDQVQQHLDRLPELEGFIIDRLDWAGHYDWGHEDGDNMLGKRSFEPMARPVARIIQEISARAHARNKRVFVNAPYRLEPLQNIDGICSEVHSRALAYLSPFRPVSSWNPGNLSGERGYLADLTPLEAQFKQRLQLAIFPQMITHTFPLSQAPPDPEAADLMEVFAPLLEKFIGKCQVLSPHCVSVTGVNEVNLFTNAIGHLIVPVTSRLKFLTHAQSPPEPVTVSIRTPSDGTTISWAHAYSADGPPYRPKVDSEGSFVRVCLDQHKSSTVLLLGTGAEPSLPVEDPILAQTRQRVTGRLGTPTIPTNRTVLTGTTNLILQLRGTQVGTPGVIKVLANGSELGQFDGRNDDAVFAMGNAALPVSPPCISLVYGDEGTWFVPRSIEFLADNGSGLTCQIAVWTESDAHYGTWDRGSFPLVWSSRCLPSPQLFSRDLQSQGNWIGRLGSKAFWIPLAATNNNGFEIELKEGTPTIAWVPPGDNRLLRSLSGTPPLYTAWYGRDLVELEIRPPNDQLSRVTVYSYDYHYEGKSVQVSLSNLFGADDQQTIQANETAQGAYLTWSIAGPVRLRVSRIAGSHVALAGLFID